MKAERGKSHKCAVKIPNRRTLRSVPQIYTRTETSSTLLISVYSRAANFRLLLPTGQANKTELYAVLWRHIKAAWNGGVDSEPPVQVSENNSIRVRVKDGEKKRETYTANVY